MEAEMSDDEKDIDNEAFVRNLANILTDAKRMLEEKCEEFGIEFDPADIGEFTEIRKRKRSLVKADDLARLAEKYAFELRPVLAAKDEWLAESGVDSETLGDVLAVIYWYQFFIAAKVQRGLHGVLDEDGDEDLDEIRDVHSDANGSIKVALIAIERSILAWTYLLDANNATVIRPFLELLDTIGRMAEEKFPNARDFVRPGFDEIETVM